jgi:hypothetical protein
MISNGCGKIIKDRNGNNDRNRKRQTMAREEKKGCWKRQTNINQI